VCDITHVNVKHMVKCNTTLFIATSCHIIQVQSIQKVKKLKPALSYVNSFKYDDISLHLLIDKSFLHLNCCLAVWIKKMWVIRSCSWDHTLPASASPDGQHIAFSPW